MTALVVNNPTCRITYNPRSVTGEADTELLTSNTHGLAVGDRVRFTALTGGTGLSTDIAYYVKTAPDADTFTLSETDGGATAAFTDDITAGTLVDSLELDDDLVSVAIERASEAVDVRTWAAPRISDAGGGVDSITLALLWSPQLYTRLRAHEGESGELLLMPDATATESITATVDYAVAPIGQLSIGSQVEADLVLGVDGITYAAS